MDNRVKKPGPKILFIQPGYAHYRRELFDKLDSNFNILFLFLKDNPNYPAYAKPNSEWNYICLNHRFKLFWIVSFVKVLSINRYDVIVSSNPPSIQSLMSLLATKLFGKKHIIWSENWCDEHKIGAWGYISKYIRVKISRYIVRNSKSIVVAGTSSYNYYRKMGISEKRLFISNQSISRPIRNEKPVFTKENLNLQNKLIILYLSRILKWKGLDILISAFAKLEKTNDNVFLMICGDGPFKSYCEKLAISHEIKNIVFLGNIPKELVLGYYGIADIFVLPSCRRGQVEAWGLVLNEATIMGKPIVTTDAVGSASDLVKNGVNGYVVKSNSVDEMHRAIRNIVDSGFEEIRKMGSNSIRINSEFNSIDKMYRGFEKSIIFSLDH